MSFRLQFGSLTVPARVMTTARQSNSTPRPTTSSAISLDQGSTHTVGFGSGQVSSDGRTRLVFFVLVGWRPPSVTPLREALPGAR